MALNAKQKLFVKEYLIDQNATRAAKACGYSDKTAHSIGHENLRKPEIAAAVRMGLAKAEEDLNKKAALLGVTKERMIQELSKVAFANMNDFAHVTTYKSKHLLGKDDKPVEVLCVRPLTTKERKAGTGNVIKKLSETKNGIGLELHSKDKAQELLCKLLGWTKNELDLNLPPSGVQVILTMPANGSEAPKPTQDATTVNEGESNVSDRKDNE